MSSVVFRLLHCSKVFRDLRNIKEGVEYRLAPVKYREEFEELETKLQQLADLQEEIALKASKIALKEGRQQMAGRILCESRPARLILEIRAVKQMFVHIAEPITEQSES